MVSLLLSSSAVNRELNAGSSQTKNYKTDMCCLSAMHAALRRKSKDWVANEHDDTAQQSLTHYEMEFVFRSPARRLDMGRITLQCYITITFTKPALYYNYNYTYFGK
jgi:hypothetical protein